MKARSQLPSPSPRRPSLRDLEFFHDFYEVLANCSTIKAAEVDLRAKWPGGVAVYYRKLAALEEYFRNQGKPDTWRLVDRTPGQHQARLTEHASELYRRIGRLLAHTEQAFTLDSLTRPEVVIATTNAMITYLLPFVLAKSAFLEDGGADVRIVEGEYWEILDQVHRHQAAFGIGPQVSVNLSEFEVVHLVEVRRGLCMHPEYAKRHRIKKPRHGQPFDLAKLADKTVLLLEPGLMRDFDIGSHLPRPVGKGRHLYLPNFAQLRVWAKYGLGVAIVHESQILPGEKELPMKQRMEYIDLSDVLGTTPVYLYFRRGGERSLNDQAELRFLAAVKEHSKEWVKFGG